MSTMKDVKLDDEKLDDDLEMVSINDESEGAEG